MSTTQAQIDAALKMIDGTHPDIAEVLRKLPISVVPMYHTTLANYDAERKELTINDSFDLELEDVVANLIHEGTHALDDTLGKLDDNDHLPSEKRAKLNEINFILARYPDGKPNNDIYDNDINRWIEEYHNGTLDAKLAEVYDPVAAMMREIFGGMEGN